MRSKLSLTLCLGIVALTGCAAARAGEDTRKSAAAAPKVTVVDGNSLIVANKPYRLHGSDAPDLGQTCIARGKSYPCGEIARTALLDLVAGGRVRCTPVPDADGGGTDAAGRRTARCFADGFDIAGNMIHTGWAVVTPGTTTLYDAAQSRARKARRGLWRGPFVRPTPWRRAQGQAGDNAQICARGRLTGRGVECQAMQSEDGTLYTFAGSGVVEAEPGAEICACGAPSAVSFCQQGQTLVVAAIRPPAQCP